MLLTCLASACAKCWPMKLRWICAISGRSPSRRRSKFTIPWTLKLESKGIGYGSIAGRPDGTVDFSKVTGVDPDLRIKPFFAEGSEFSIRRFIVGALHNEMALEASSDPDIFAANPTKDNFPQFGHGSIKLTLLFNDPADPE